MPREAGIKKRGFYVSLKMSEYFSPEITMLPASQAVDRKKFIKVIM